MDAAASAERCPCLVLVRRRDTLPGLAQHPEQGRCHPGTQRPLIVDKMSQTLTLEHRL